MRRRAKRDAKATARPSAPPARFTRGWCADWLKTLGIAAAIFLVSRNFVFATAVITSGSMEETLAVSDYLLVNRMALGSGIPGTAIRIPGYSEPRHDDIIVFRADHSPGVDIVKRTIGLPGDLVAMRDGVLYRNGVIVNEPYVRRDPIQVDGTHPDMAWQLDVLDPSVDRSSYRPTRENWGPLVIPDQRYFMLGDNRDNSLDSRWWGLVERENMRGRVFFIYYSFDSSAPGPFRPISAARPARIGPLRTAVD